MIEYSIMNQGRWLAALGVAALLGCGGKGSGDDDDAAGEAGDAGTGGSTTGGKNAGTAGRGGMGAAAGKGGGRRGGGGAAGSGSGGSAGAMGSPFAECGSVIDCSGELCVDPQSEECKDGGCLEDLRAGFDFHCTKACTADGDCPAGYSCTEINVAGGSRGTYCAKYQAACGNGVVDVKEACDDGNTADADGCSADCRSDETCGNALVDAGEACDDGNTTGGDGCSADCRSDETCGNDVLDVGEECDDGNTSGEDGCEADCTSSGCGNGHPTPPEACDDEEPGCDTQCRIVPVDGIAELGRYPDDPKLSYTSIVTAAGKGGRLLVSWLDPPNGADNRNALVSSDGGGHFSSRRSAALGNESYRNTLLRGTTGNEAVFWQATGSLELLIRRSANLGETWEDVQTVSVPTLSYPEDTDMYAAGDDWYFLWVDFISAGKYSIWLAHSSDAGQTWSAPVTVAELPSSCSALSVTGSVDGHVLVTACSTPLFSEDHGATFAPVTTTGPWDIDDRAAKQLVALGDGHWVAPGGLAYYETSDDFASWSYTDLGGGWSGEAVMLLDSTGALWLGHGGRLTADGTNQVVVERSLDKGKTWDPPTIIAEHPYPGSVLWGMTSGEAGTYVYWSFVMSGGTETDAALHYVMSDDGGTTWSDPVIMGDLTNNYIGPYYSFITGGDGAVHAFWTEHPKNGGSIPPLFLRYARLTQ
jgi:cysteine-rich repeat protein